MTHMFPIHTANTYAGQSLRMSTSFVTLSCLVMYSTSLDCQSCNMQLGKRAELDMNHHAAVSFCTGCLVQLT